jgi:Predicted transmembrane transcriptional regulator (anti-sigma factor)
MTAHVPQSDHQIVDLLPAYLTGTLDDPDRERVKNHLQHCEACQRELTDWKALQATTSRVLADVPLPSLAVMDQVWAQIDAETLARTAWHRSLLHRIQHFWLVLSRQVPLLHKSIWFASPLIIALACLFVIFARTGNIPVRSASTLISLCTAVIAASGMAFIYSGEHDEGLEITLTTPTSIRLVLVSRSLLVIGYNILLGTIASAIVAIIYGGSIAHIIQMWLGPVLFLSSLSLVFSFFIGSTFAMFGTLIVELSQAISFNTQQGLIMLQFNHSALWQTNWWMLTLAVILITFAIIYAPRKKLSMHTSL